MKYLEKKDRPWKLKLFWLLNLGWYLGMIVAGSLLHRKGVEGFLLPLFILTVAGGLFLGRLLLGALKGVLMPGAAKKEFFRSGAFVENLRTEVQVIVARMSICVVEEWRVQRGLPLPPVLTEIPIFNKLGKLRDETTLRMVARDNRVQYCVTLSNLTSNDILYDEESGKLSLFLPELRLDEGLIEVQTDPTKIWIMTEKGFYDRLTDWFSGTTQRIHAEMRGKLRELVVAEASAPENLALARRNAALELSNLVKVLANKTGGHLISKVDISFGNYRELEAASEEGGEAWKVKEP
ncbi:MAG: hypothetical protein ACOX2U_01355 [Limisphaerales bacterium]|nr:hypothetical protein [Verrucomicrobiota bacterium]